MALKHKKIKDSNGDFINEPVKCSFCKEKKAYAKIHGGYVHSAGKTCCDHCITKVRKEEESRKRIAKGGYTEADHQTWLRL